LIIKRHFNRIIAVLLIPLVLASCSTTKRLKENQFLLVKNDVKVVNPSKNFNGSDLESLIIQTPNKRFLGIIPFNLWINSMFKKLGSPPVPLDQSMIEESKLQMNQYLNNSGFYNSSIEHTIDFRKKKARKVSYLVTLSEPYTILNYSFNIPDTAINRLVTASSEQSLVQAGKIFNTFTLDNERNRITQKLNNSGYFGFSKDYIFYEADSALGSRQVNLVLNVKNYLHRGRSQYRRASAALQPQNLLHPGHHGQS
jgi:hypothetical protein